MNLIQLPFYDFLEKIYHHDYPSLPFYSSDYWFLLFIMVAVIAVACGLVYLACCGIYDYFDKRSATIEMLTGELIDKRYVGEQSITGSGTAIVPNTNGGVGVGFVSTSSHSDEEFILFVSADKIYKMKVDMQQFYSKNIGDKVNFGVTIGGKSKKELSVELKK